MFQSFRGYFASRIAIAVVLLVAACTLFYVYRSGQIIDHIQTQEGAELIKRLEQRLDKKLDMGRTQAIFLSADADLATLVARNQRSGALKELSRIRGMLHFLPDSKNLKVQIFNQDYTSFLRSWAPDQFGDHAGSMVPLLEKVAASGKVSSMFVTDSSGVYIRSTYPLKLQGTLIGYLQVIQDVGNVSRAFETEGVFYALFMNADGQAKAPVLRDNPHMGSMILAHRNWFSNKVVRALGTLDIENLVQHKRIITSDLCAVAKPLFGADGKILGAHILAQPAGKLNVKTADATHTALLLLVAACCGFAAIGVLVVFLLGKAVSGPLLQLQAYANAVTKQDNDSVLPEVMKYECDSLRGSMVKMVEHLEHRSSLAHAREQKALDKIQEVESLLDASQKNGARSEKLLQRIQKAVDKADHISQSVLSAVEELGQEVSHVSEGVKVQRDRMGETASAMEEMTITVMEVARNATSAADSASSSREKASTGASGVREAVEAIQSVQHKILGLKGTMANLGDQAASIGQVLNVITDIADQTNLLALNAAIEAARAGKAGRGFAVVADEVRKLAEKTMAATREVESVILAIQHAADENVVAVETAAREIVQSTDIANRSGGFMEEIVAIVEGTTEQVVSIAAASEQQSATTEEINRAVSDVNGVALETAERMERSADNLGSIVSLISELNAIIRRMATAQDAEEIQIAGPLIIWSSNLCVGVKSIDAQHKKLVGMINDLHEAMKEKTSRTVMVDIVGRLKDYVVTHFKHEEHIFDAHGYPEAEAHKLIHNQFVERILDFEEGLQGGQATLSLEVLQFLKDWLVDHIMGTDKEYVPFMKEHNVV